MRSKPAGRFIIDFLSGLILPVIVILYPIIFLYANNVTKVNFRDTIGVALLFIGISIGVYLISALAYSWQFNKASLVSSALLALFAFYGDFYNFFYNKDLFPVYHFNLLPLLLLIPLLLIYLIRKLDKSTLKKIILLSSAVLALLIVFNLIKIIPVEVTKARQKQASLALSTSSTHTSESNYPDVYYLMYDEFAGISSIHEFWNFTKIDNLVAELERKGFTVIKESKGSLANTLHQLATRLNYEEADVTLSETEFFDLITDNKVMTRFRELGYKIVVLDEARSNLAYPTKPIMPGDLHLEDIIGEDDTVEIENTDFRRLVYEKSALLMMDKYIDLSGPAFLKHHETVSFAKKHIGDDFVPSPKFVYAHLMLPHFPFIYNAEGNFNPPQYIYEWSHYIGQYEYTMEVISHMTDNILEKANPQNPPIIIVQSDHGARNQGVPEESRLDLPGFTEEDRMDIFFAVYAPACPELILRNDENPINTFPLIFNCLFDDNLPIR